jgi:hypothetical protein
MTKALLAGAAITFALAAPAFAETLKIGFLTTLSGPMAPIGQHARDGFLLAVEQRGGKLGGLETEVIVQDDSLKPELAVGHAQKFIEGDQVHFVVGMIASNILQAVFQPITESETFMIGVNAGTSIYAGAKSVLLLHLFGKQSGAGDDGKACTGCRIPAGRDDGPQLPGRPGRGRRLPAALSGRGAGGDLRTAWPTRLCSRVVANTGA